MGRPRDYASSRDKIARGDIYIHGCRFSCLKKKPHSRWSRPFPWSKRNEQHCFSPLPSDGVSAEEIFYNTCYPNKNLVLPTDARGLVDSGNRLQDAFIKMGGMLDLFYRACAMANITSCQSSEGLLALEILYMTVFSQNTLHSYLLPKTIFFSFTNAC